ncbi:ATP-binding protein [Olsenella sp. oral taxon 807]|uniref:ATP-binding protein n=1 Tax=Olsenella sp. oral taxon 807 TaxID=712411 RepID=UPI00067E40B9|nr:AAA family ATPase [Olsenella sp. oral taxon 807]
MERAEMRRLLDWKSSPQRKPLLLFGARQVGKSYLIEQFARENYEKYALFNLEEDPRLTRAFDGNLDPCTVISNLSQITGHTLDTENMLYVFDEAQVSNRALTALKYFQEANFSHPIIAAGSLLGVAVNQRYYSLPVGRVNTMVLHPMTFDEFMGATGHALMLEGIREAYFDRRAYQLHDQAMGLYRTYLLVGGMPEAVAAYARTGDVRDAVRVHRDILNLYLADMVKYAPSPTDVARARDVWNSVPGQLAKENHKFQYRQVRSGGRSSEYEGAISWLLSAGLIDKCMRVSSGQVPLRLHEDRGSFKIYANDVGLLSTMSGIPASALFDERGRSLLDTGGLTENYVVQQMVARGIEPRYWTSGNRAEIDLVVEDGSAKAVPIEIKSTKNVRSRSLGVYRDKYEPDRVVRVSARNFGTGDVESIPLYAVGCLADDVAMRRGANEGMGSWAPTV